MIIECQSCHARFRLDEARIKGKGARVKCRRCGGSILVLKDEAPPPPPPRVADDSFDLGTAVRNFAAEEPDIPPPGGNLIPFPAPSRPAEPAAPESSADRPDAFSTFPEAPEAGKDEVDRAFDMFFSDDGQASSPSMGEKEAPATVERESSADRTFRPEQDLGALTLDLGPEEKLDLPPAVAGVGDISFAISPAPADGESSFPRGNEAPPDPSWDRFSPAEGGNSIEGNSTPAAMPVNEAPPPLGGEPASPPPVESAAWHETPAPESPRPRSSGWPAAAAVLAVLLAAGGYLGLTTSGRKTLNEVVPGVAALWGGNPAASRSPKYDLRNVIGYYESGSASPRILVIKGQVANLSTGDKNGIRVEAALLDNTDAVLMQQAVYAGNVLSGEAIRKGDRDTLLKTLGNRFGEGLSNMHVAPGKAIPFMVVFFDAPANIESYKLEAKDSE